MSERPERQEPEAPAAPKRDDVQGDTEAQPPAIVRADLEAVIRRAVELSLTEREAQEQLSEDEVIRIATEVGLPAHLARQALYERPLLDSPEAPLDGWFGRGIIAASRSIPRADADRLRRRLEDYLSTHEYLQLVRRRGGRLFFVPAEDTISALARGLFRPSSRYQLARARRVLVDVRSLDESSSHVQIATDYSQQRQSAARGAAIGGGIAGVALGGLGAALIAVQAPPGIVAGIAEIGAFLGIGAATVASTLRIAGRGFKRRMAEARTELEGLLDRAEHGERLEPPPAPWRRKLQQRLRGI